jgi:hypothetical protein
MQWRFRERRDLRAQVHLIERGPAVIAHHAERRAQTRDWIRQIRQDNTADDRVEVAFEFDISDVACDKRHLRHLQRSRPCACGGYDLRIRVHTHNAASRTDKLSRNQRDIACTAAEIQHLHSGRNTRVLEQPPRRLLEQFGLMLQTARFAFGSPKYVGWVALAARVHQLPVPDLRTSSKAV